MGVMNVLLVEDDLNDVEMILRGIEEVSRGQAKIYVVSTLKEAKDAVTKQKPDMVILDLSLPDSDDQGTYQGTATWIWPTPMLMLTGCRRHVFQDVFKNSGTNVFCKDGIDYNMLWERMQEVVEEAVSRIAAKNGHKNVSWLSRIAG